MESTHLDLGRLVRSEVDRLVAAEAGHDGVAMLYCRDEDGTVSRREVPFRPWLLVNGESLAAELPGVEEVRHLSGSGIHAVQVFFAGAKAYYGAVDAIRRITGTNPSSPQAPYRLFADLSQQLLTMIPARLFRGMGFQELRRMQVDIETFTTPGYDFCNAEREGDAIVMIAMRDSTGWEHLLHGPEQTEAEMLRELVRLVRERDPDVIEGHNIFSFDLPYIETRARRHRVHLVLGRDGSTAKKRSSRFTAGERTSTYTRYDIAGRHVIDTLHLVQLYDVGHREMSSYGLKSSAAYFGVSAPERTYVDGSRISEVYRTDPARLRAYAMDDVRETDGLSRVLSPSYFHQAQLVPYSFQNCVTRGNATRIDAMLCAEYLLAGEALPSPQAPRGFQGGLTESLQEGVFRDVWHADVRSLYPSIIISRNLTPRSDRLGLYRRMLAELRSFRLAARDAARSAAPDRREYLEALQSTFKVLINSFYGYAGFAQGTFNDYDLAETVTAEGRRILQSMLDSLRAARANVIEMDTDGIYFVPPAGVTEPAVMEDTLQAVLPAGIDIDLDATYAAMFGYKAKNYALLHHDGKVTITGAALKSRGLEPFQRTYIRDAVERLLTGRAAELPGLYEERRSAIESRALPLAEFAQREVLSMSPRTYAEKLAAGKTRRSAAYELALRSGREYQQGDTVVFYVTGDRKNVVVTDCAKLLADAAAGERDENVPYYLDKLSQLQRKFVKFMD
ncbi:MAG: DNA polymerase II [Lentisphaeria bacterium]|nr:DNA polymerase II [Lentisphaeria bacterium]